MTELSDAIKEYLITTSRDQVLKDHKEVQTRNSTIFIADRETPEDYRKHAFSKPHTMTDRQVRARLGLCKPDPRDKEELDKLVKRNIEHYLH